MFPDWNSLDSVRRAHSDLEANGLIFFALLVIAEVLAHATRNEKRKHLFETIGIWVFAIAVVSEIAGYPYGQRNDALSEQVIRSLDKLATNAKDASGIALATSAHASAVSDEAIGKADKAEKTADSLDTRMDAASTKLDGLEERLAWRTISPQQYATFGKALLPFANSKVVVFVFDNEDLEAKTFAADLMHFFHDAAKWEPVLNDTNVSVPLPTGLTCQADTDTPAGRALCGLMEKYGAKIVPTKIPGYVGVIRIGIKPPP